MNKKQLNRYETLRRAIDRLVTVQEAAEALGISERQIKRLKKAIKEEGPAAIIHKNKLRSSPHALKPDTIEKILELKRSEVYEGCNFKHFRELLSEHHEIELAYSTLYKILRADGISSPMTRRRMKPHRRRKRKPQAGLLLQIDATPFAWFKGDTHLYALHGAIDDATGQITALYMTKNECLHGYFETMRRTMQNYGIPVGVYADRHTIFQSPNKSKAEIDPTIPVNDTQFGRALKELGITLIAARSPQAKGRIERLWLTLQSRLPIEFRLRDIQTIDEANEFLKTYIYAFNSEFAIEPESAESMFQAPQGISIDYILCIKEKRMIDSGGVISFEGRSFKVVETALTGCIPKGAKVLVLADPSFGVKIEFRNIIFDVLPFVPPKKVKPKQAKPARVYAPASDTHYWKYGQRLAPKLTFEDNDEAVILMLEDIFLRRYPS